MILSQVCNKILFCLKLFFLCLFVIQCSHDNSIAKIDEYLYVQSKNQPNQKKADAVRISYKLWRLPEFYNYNDILPIQSFSDPNMSPLDSGKQELFFTEKLMEGFKKAVNYLKKNDTTYIYFSEKYFTFNQQNILIVNTKALLYQVYTHDIIYLEKNYKNDTTGMNWYKGLFSYKISANPLSKNRLKQNDTVKMDIRYENFRGEILYDSQLDKNQLEFQINEKLLELYRIPLLESGDKDSISIFIPKGFMEETDKLLGTNNLNSDSYLHIYLK